MHTHKAWITRCPRQRRRMTGPLKIRRFLVMSTLFSDICYTDCNLCTKVYSHEENWIKLLWPKMCFASSVSQGNFCFMSGVDSNKFNQSPNLFSTLHFSQSLQTFHKFDWSSPPPDDKSNMIKTVWFTIEIFIPSSNLGQWGMKLMWRCWQFAICLLFTWDQLQTYREIQA